jgi:hypothetical protein
MLMSEIRNNRGEHLLPKRSESQVAHPVTRGRFKTYPSKQTHNFFSYIHLSQIFAVHSHAARMRGVSVLNLVIVDWPGLLNQQSQSAQRAVVLCFDLHIGAALSAVRCQLPGRVTAQRLRLRRASAPLRTLLGRQLRQG